MYPIHGLSSDGFPYVCTQDIVYFWLWRTQQRVPHLLSVLQPPRLTAYYSRSSRTEGYTSVNPVHMQPSLRQGVYLLVFLTRKVLCTEGFRYYNALGATLGPVVPLVVRASRNPLIPQSHRAGPFPRLPQMRTHTATKASQKNRGTDTDSEREDNFQARFYTPTLSAMVSSALNVQTKIVAEWYVPNRPRGIM